MPDLVSVIRRRWKLMVYLPLFATLVALLACLLSPKEYAGIVTALPANSLVSDKARIFNRNIEALYAEIGTPDDLDKLEGTAKLDTIFLATAAEFQLPAYYGIDPGSGDALEKAVLRLRKNTAINRTGFGELKIKVWDKESKMAATLANALMEKLSAIHQRLQTENNRVTLEKLEEEYRSKQQALDSISGTVLGHKRSQENDSSASASNQGTGQLQNKSFQNTAAAANVLSQQVEQYAKLIAEYELALKTSPKPLLVVEPARASPWADKPKTGLAVLLAFSASLLFSFLLALLAERRNEKA